MLRYWLYICLILPLAGCGSAESSDKPVNQVPEAIPVTLALVERQHRPDPITGTGVTSGKEETKLSFKIGGILEQITVDEGDRVKEGQLLARLSLTEIDAQVKQAQIGLDKTTRDLERLERLYTDKVVTLEQVQDARTALDLATAALDIAQFNQSHAQIYAPSNGTVLKRFAERRELLSPGLPVLLVSSSARQQILRLGVTDREVVQLQRGDSASVSFDAYPDISFQATITELAEQSSPQTGTYEIELALAADREHPIKIGFIGHAMIYPSIQLDQYLIPMSALVEADRDSIVLFVPDATQQVARRLTIRPLRIGQKFISVLQSDAPSLNLVITRGASYLTHNAKIMVKN